MSNFKEGDRVMTTEAALTGREDDSRVLYGTVITSDEPPHIRAVAFDLNDWIVPLHVDCLEPAGPEDQ